VDLKTRSWAVPDTPTHNGLAHEVPLSALSIRILENLQSCEEERRQGFAFRKRHSGRGFSGWSKAERVLDRRIEEVTHLRPFWQVRDKAAA
jgi:hypothetical protein